MSQINLTTPLSDSIVRSLKSGDRVTITGNLFTARDKLHSYLLDQSNEDREVPFSIKEGILYHCGPLIKKSEEGYEIISAGPTTSTRLEMYEPALIKHYGIRAIIGKGGMGEKSLAAFKESGCVYLHTISGAGVYLADRIRKVTDVWKLEEFGIPEAMWLFEVEDFPALVTMDTHGNSLHEEIKNSSFAKAMEL